MIFGTAVNLVASYNAEKLRSGGETMELELDEYGVGPDVLETEISKNSFEFKAYYDRVVGGLFRSMPYCACIGNSIFVSEPGVYYVAITEYIHSRLRMVGFLVFRSP